MASCQRIMINSIYLFLCSDPYKGIGGSVAIYCTIYNTLEQKPIKLPVAYDAQKHSFVRTPSGRSGG
jgi:hypothetical protein